jgi:hypothetical protein
MDSKRALASLGAALLAVAAHAQVGWGQLDDFENGTTMNWGGGASPENVADGGPLGPGDAWLRMTSDGGSGPGSRLACFNDAQWSGNFVGAGVSIVEMDVLNVTALELSLRIVLFDLNDFTQWTSTVPVLVSPGSGWVHASFPLLESDLTRVEGIVSYQDVITSVDRFMIRHQVGAPNDRGTRIAGQMGMDNVHAVPEPAGLLALGLGALAAYRRLQRR